MSRSLFVHVVLCAVLLSSCYCSAALSNGGGEVSEGGPTPTNSAAASAASSAAPADNESSSGTTTAVLPLPKEFTQPAPALPSATSSLTIEQRIAETNTLLSNLETQISKGNEWAKSVHEIIANYQFKYSKVLKELKSRGQKADKLRQILTQLKKAKLHQSLSADLEKANEALGQISTASPEGATDYNALKTKVDSLKDALNKLSSKSVGDAVANSGKRLFDASQDELPPASTDALKFVAKHGQNKDDKAKAPAPAKK